MWRWAWMVAALSAVALPGKAAEPKIPVAGAVLINEQAHGDAHGLLDEQALAGDPALGKGGQPKNGWFPGWPAGNYPAGVVIDLGAEYSISQIWLYDGSGTGDIVFEGGTPFQWKPLATDPQAAYNQWVGHTVSFRTRYVHVIATCPTVPAEIVLYGTRVPTSARTPRPLVPVRRTAKTPKPSMDTLIGVNGFIDDPLDVLAVGSHVREYHNWGWDEGDGDPAYAGYPHSAEKFNPSYGGGWNFDAYYSSLKALGVTVAPVIQGSPSWMAKDPDDKPVPKGADPEQPSSYAAHAAHLFQLAARYGSRRVDKSLLTLAPGQQPLTGLRTLHYYENWNEEDKWWKGRTGYFSPYEMAAMCSADADGDRGKMGKTFGIRNADPSAVLVMGGTAGLSLDYIEAMAFWFDWKRNHDNPIGVINVHTYSTDAKAGGVATGGISPEADHLREKLARIVTFRDRRMPWAEVWLSEFGYDTHPGSPFHAPAIGTANAEEVQGEWIVRGFLAVAAAGVDRAQVFMIRDVDGANPGQFSSSGLTTSKADGWRRKPAWYYAHTLAARLKGMRFDTEVSSGDPRVSIYRFRSQDKSKAAYVLWCPTSSGTTVPHYKPQLRPGESYATLVTLTSGVPTGRAEPLNPRRPVIDVSERPVILLVTAGNR